MPNAFTPNGDGKNDVFRIPPDATLNLEEFSIYDRWGAKIFSTKNVGEAGRQNQWTPAKYRSIRIYS